MTPRWWAEPRGRAWWFHRGLLIGSVIAFVLSAGEHGGTLPFRWVFVGSGFLVAALVGFAWKRDEVTTGEVLFFAALFRLAAFPLLPTLSDDGFRYVWDGWLQLHGFNPYLSIPSEVPTSAMDASGLLARLNSASYYSVYPPSSQLVFWLGSVIGGGSWLSSWYVIKGMFVAIEWCGVWALSRMVSARALVLYAWHPLVLIEVAGQGHTEGGMVGLILLALFFYQSGRPARSVAALTVAGWFKLYPLLLLPFLLVRTGWRYVWVVGVVTIALLLPYTALSVVSNIAESLNLYVQLFEFNAGPYYLLKSIGLVGFGEDWSKTLGPLLRYVFLLGVVGIFAVDQRVRWPVAWGWVATIGLLWFTATTVHPWYLVGILALLPLVVDRDDNQAVLLNASGWLWLSVASLGTYLLYADGDRAYWAFVILGWGGAVALWGAALLHHAVPAIMRYRARRKWSRIRPHLELPAPILDLGAGEGYVGVEASKEHGNQVTLADVVDFNRTSLPLILYDGRRLPFETDRFGAALLVFVLHHTEDPDTVLREVRRVTRSGGRVAMMESVVENRLDAWWLPFADRWANRLRSGGQMSAQEEHLHFRSTAAWRDSFSDAGFEVVLESRRGRVLHKQVLFVLQ
jgi:SAM-dependent methyltransferase